ncbi:MAG: hypothetical protein H6815_01140 [Phycisphaeraceae bacterium]|nr:hypothetical protein [Phycisphaerales bacterium]MCB9859031.1 hypothetical protein [Phycisphaeraceae bacterium]
MRQRIHQRLLKHSGVVCAAFACLACTSLLTGCELIAIALIAKRDLPKHVDASYRGLDNAQGFAVMVSADRSIQATNPGAVMEIAARTAENLRDFYAKQPDPVPGWVPPVDVLSYQYDNPRWYLRPRGEVAADLGVDRLIVISLEEYRLTDPGNTIEWNGVVSGRVTVYEEDSLGMDDVAFEHPVTVRFPDKTGYDENSYQANQIASVLVSKFAKQSAELFYDHMTEGRISSAN